MSSSPISPEAHSSSSSSPNPLSPASSSSPSTELMSVRVMADEEDDDAELGDETPLPRTCIPYRAFGIGFLLVAIISAVVLAAVPASIDATGKLTNEQNGFFYHALIGVFLLMLFSCLFFTYYLGGSKETWVDPEFSGIRMNFSNITAVIGLLLEFVQICSFSYNPHATFKGSDSLIRMQYAAIPFAYGSSFIVMYWIMFVVAFSPYIFVVSVRLIIYTINKRKGEAEAAAFVGAYQQRIYSTLWFLVNTIYIPVITTMMEGVDCTFKTLTDSAGNVIGEKNTVDYDEALICLSPDHIKYIVCSMIALVIYYPAASFAQSQTQNISDIKFKPKIVFVFVQGKVLLAGCAIFFTDYTTFYLSFVLVVDVIFLCVNLWKSPCLVQWVNQLRTIFFVISTATVIASFISTSPHIDPNVPLAILVIGWAVAGIGLPILFFVYGKVLEMKKH